jgi:Arc/MetJ family transcription regulator
MRTNIDIEDKLMRQAMKATGAKTKKAAVEESLRKVVQLKKQERILRWRGKIRWEGDLKSMRESRFLNKEGFFEQDIQEETVKANEARQGERPARDSSPSR